MFLGQALDISEGQIHLLL